MKSFKNNSKSLRQKGKQTGREFKRNLHEKQPSNFLSGKRIIYLLISVSVIGLGVGAVLSLVQSEDKKVRESFYLFSEAMLKKSGESVFTLDQKIKKIASLVDETCEIKIPAYGLSGVLTREEITGYATRGRFHFSQLQLKFHDFDISFTGPDTSTVRLTAKLTGKTTAGETVNEAHEVECLLKKIEKKWIFSAIEAIEVLKR